MGLLTPGYFPSTYFPKNYWPTDYWAEYGSALVSFVGLLTVKITQDSFEGIISQDETTVNVSQDDLGIKIIK